MRTIISFNVLRLIFDIFTWVGLELTSTGYNNSARAACSSKNWEKSKVATVLLQAIADDLILFITIVSLDYLNSKSVLSTENIESSLNDLTLLIARCQPTCRIFLNLSLWGLCPQTPKVFLQ
ncbi:MAG: hypothetical protein KZQ74_15035, partial [gamma proteobacterium symbiont of Bathyaustriella thionipta]|nr:hypothetical protein [gamma proteobacterium symbiont of Bathyaustriella thionipta]